MAPCYSTTVARELNFPDIPRIATPRLVLREITEADLDSYNALCSDPEVMKTWGTPPHLTKNETLSLIRYLKKAHEERMMFRWGIALKGKEETLVGDVGFWRFVKERYRAEAGAKLAKPLWSGGYMTEALAACVEFGFLGMGLHSVEANVDPSNTGAIRLVQKVGFVQEGMLREHSYDCFTDSFIDTALFSVTAGRWRK